MAAAFAGLATRVPRVAMVAGLAALAFVLYDGARREVGVTFDQTTAGLHDVARWDHEVRASESIRIDVPASGWQMWCWYFLPHHRVSVTDPLAGIFPHPPYSRKADLVLVMANQREPGDAVGPPVRRNAEYVLYRLRRDIPGPDLSSRALIGGVNSVSF